MDTQSTKNKTPHIMYGSDGDDFISGYNQQYGTALGEDGGLGIIYGGNGNDTLAGALLGSSIIYGDNGNDLIIGGQEIHGAQGYEAIGTTELHGGSGNDILYAAGTESSIVFGDDGNDTLYGSAFGPSILNGGAGNDTFFDSLGNDIFIGGAGYNTYIMGNSLMHNWLDDGGTNTISYTTTDAQGKKQYDSSVTRSDTIDFSHFIRASFRRDGDDLVVTGVPVSDYNRTESETFHADSIYRIECYFDPHHPVSKIIYGGQDLRVQDVSQLIDTYGNDTLLGTKSDDMIYLERYDSERRIIHTRQGNDTVDCGRNQNNVTVYADQGNDTITDAYLVYGGSGNDTYSYTFKYFDSDKNAYFTRALHATIVENDNTKNNQDTLIFDTAESSQLWFTKSGKDLKIAMIGTDAQVTIQNWYVSSAQHIEQIKAGDKTLTDTNVSKLVSAMATMTPPAAGQTTLPANYQTQLASVLTASWK